MPLQLEPMQPEGRDGSVFDEEKNFLKTQLENYVPWNEQEEKDRRIMLFSLDMPGIFTRENLLAHFTASAWICNKDRRKVMMAYHKIYDSWAWTGGHADGQRDLLSVAIREAGEETGVCAAPLSRDIFSLEILTVDGHEKRGSYVPSHLHFNVTYLLEVDEKQNIRIKADENAGVAWFELEEALEKCTEPWMVQRIYRKLNEKLLAFSGGNQSGL